MKLNYLLYMLLAGVFIVACGSDDPDDMTTCDTTDLTYTADIASIIDASCATAGCHAAGATAPSFEMHDYATTKVVADFGRIVGAINHTDNFSAMPQGGDKLADCDISKITEWIADGAPE